MRSLRYNIYLLILWSSLLFAQTNKVILITADCSVNPALVDYIETGIEKAIKDDAQCLILQLNTPGGLLSCTRQIVAEFLNSKVPIIVYVSPAGSQAASAGVFITLASNIAVMAPGTNIGAAHPVTLQGTQDSIMIEKATNDASAFIRTISEKRNRNISWSEKAVRRSLSITEEEALELKVIDYIAKDIPELMIKINDNTVETKTGKKKLDGENYKIVHFEMSISQRILSILSDPNVVYILFMLGIYGLFFELYNPGTIFPGVIGAICIILAFYSMNTLPINYAGLALIILSLILFILEIKIISHGLLTIGGIISLLLGSLMLVDPESILETIEISMELIIFIIIITTLFFLVVISLGIKAQKRKPVTGVEGLIGERGTAITDINPDGEIIVHGEFWKAKGVENQIYAGNEIEVVGVDNLILSVRKFEKS